MTSDLQVFEGVSDQTSAGFTYNSSMGTVELTDPDHRWIWFTHFSRPGTYTVSAQVAVAYAHAGATLSLGEWISARGEGSTASTALAATDPAADANPTWQTVGEIRITEPGRHELFARMSDSPGNSPGLLSAIRLEGPGDVDALPSWSARTSACDPQTNGATSNRQARYAEIIPTPWPQRYFRGTFSTCQGPGGYVGCQESFFWSSWESGGVFPEILAAFGGTRAYDHEGSGRTISFEDFQLPLDRRRQVLVMTKPDGSGGTIATVLVGEARQAWYLLGRMRTPPGATGISSALGFLENPGVFDSHLVRRSSGWANPWFYSGSAHTWGRPSSLKAHLRGPSPTDPEPLATGTYPWGESRMRQDLMEMVIGGRIVIAQNDTNHPMPAAAQPAMPTLQIAIQLPAEDEVIQAADATAGGAYVGELAALIADPFSSVPFQFAKAGGPAWLAVNNDGSLSGNPSAAEVGQNLFSIIATDEESGLVGTFTVGLLVKSGGNNAPVFSGNPAEVRIAAATLPVSVLPIRYHEGDAGDAVALSIDSGNAGGLFAIDPATDTLLTSGAVPADTTWNLGISATDDGTPAKSDTLALTVVSGPADLTGGLFRENWFLLEGSTPVDLTSSPRYPGDADQESLVGAMEDEATGKNTGTRLRGWIHPPVSGDYTFWISGDDEARLLLSDDDSATAVQICEATNSSGFRQYDASASQQSSPISLIGGQRYYIELLHKRAGASGGTAGSFSVAWEGPGFTREPVAASFLSPWKHLSPRFFSDAIEPRPVLAGESYREYLRTKLRSIHLHPGLEYSKVSGPSWLQVSADGELTGTPSAGDAGTNVFVLRTTAPGGLCDETTATIAVSENHVPTWPAGTLDLGSYDEGTSLDIDVAPFATDPDRTTVFDLGDRLSFRLSGAPPWLFIDETGRLYGKPGADEVGSVTFQIIVTDLTGAEAVTDASMEIIDIETAPVWVGDPLVIPAAVQTSLSHDLGLDVYDGDPEETFVYQKLSGDPWFSISPSGLLTGLPGLSEIGVHEGGVKVTDSTGRTATTTLRVVVKDPDPTLYEGFEGISGAPLQNFGSGVGWGSASSWTASSGSVSVLGTGNSFPGLTSLGQSAAMGGGEDYSRALGRTYHIGSGPDAETELWISWSIDNPGPIAIGHSFLLGLTHGGVPVLTCGKEINGTWGLAGGGQDSVLVASSSSGNLGNWRALLHLESVGGDTVVTAYLAKEGDAGLDPLDPGTYPRTASVAIAGTLSFDSVAITTHNTVSARFDEIAFGNTAERALSQAADTDADGTPNYLDEDDDDDGVNDKWEALLGLDPLVADASLAPEPVAPGSSDFGALDPDAGPYEFSIPVQNIGVGEIDLELHSDLTAPPGWELLTPNVTVASQQTGEIRVRIVPGGTPGTQGGDLQVMTNSPAVPSFTVGLKAFILPAGTLLAHYDFDPDNSAGALLDSNNLTPGNVGAGDLTDQATGNGALSSPNQGTSNRAVQPLDGTNVLWFSSNREGDGETPLASGGNDESTWITFDVTPSPGHEIDFTDGTLFLRSFARTTLGSATSADWKLHASSDGGATYQFVDGAAGASTSDGSVAALELALDLSSLGVRSGSIRFAIDPVSTGGLNGNVVQRGVGVDDIMLAATVVEPGGFAAWAGGHGQAADPAGDDDHDVIPLLVEYALGLNPGASDGSPGVLADGAVSYSKGPDAIANGDVAFGIQVSSDLGVNDPWHPPAGGVTENANSISYHFSSGPGPEFVRLVVTLPP
ncbi:MAG: hypothetical protein H7A49_04175 [Akkermansiaceae bacterium]|nr:hypothetical protein [Akkermansiaceae bacterium]